MNRNIMCGSMRLLKGVAALAVLAVAARATTITTTSFTTWKTPAYLASAPTELNFLAINSTSYNTAAGITLTPSGSTTAFTVTGMNNGSYSLSGDIYSKTLAGSSNSGAYINIGFQTAQNAFLLGFANNSAMTYTVTLSDGQVFSTTSKLLGFSVSHTITGLTVATSPGTQAVLNDFWFGTSALTQDAATPTTPTTTPEPATLLLMTGGSLVLAGAKRKLRGELR